MEQTIDIPNIGALGTWGAINNFNDSKIAWGALAGLVSATVRDDSVHYAAIGEAVSALFLNKKTIILDLLDSVEGLSDQQREFLDKDVSFGLNSYVTLQRWIQAVISGINSDMARILKDHFWLTEKQLFEILSALQSHVTAAEDTLGGRFGCVNNRCTSEVLVANQWANQGVTNGVHLDPIKREPSISKLNHTVFGFPEFGYWLDDHFLPSLSENQRKKFEGVTMPVDVAERLIKVS